MARKPPHDEHSDTPIQQDEADILAEAGGEPGESGEVMVSEERARELGALDPESVRENRRMQAIVNKKRANMKGVPFGTSDPLVLYDMLAKVWGANGIDIHVRRLTGPPVQHVITSRPRSGPELYEALKAIHGQSGEAEYEVRFVDASRKEYRGMGRITMPDTRPTGQQQGQPAMTTPYYPPGYPLPPGFQAMPVVPVATPTAPAPAAPPAVAAPGPAPNASIPQPVPPVVVQAPSGPDMSSMLTSMGQMFEMFRSIQQQTAQAMQQAAQANAAAQAQPAQAQVPQPQFVMPVPPPTTTPDMMAQVRQMFEMFQAMQPAQQPQPQPARGQQPQAQPPIMPNPMSNPMMAAMLGMPPIQPPPGTIWVPGFGFVPLDRLTQVLSGGGPGGPGPSSGPPYRGPYRPPYYRGGGEGPPPYYRGEGPPPYYREEPPPPYGPYGPHGPPQREKTPAEQFREALTVVRTAVQAVQDINEMLPTAGGAAPQGNDGEEDDDNPVRVIDTGVAKLVVNKEDGKLRWAETGMMALPDVLKWLGEQREAIQKAHAQQQGGQQTRVLPPGYVEVGPGYKPPPGFVAVPVDPQDIPAAPTEPLPPPPTDMPPPIQPRRMWDAPKIPAEGEG
jgi:hypothetical protein